MHRRRRRSSLPPPFTSPAEMPLIFTALDMARTVRASVRTIRRQVRAGTFVPKPFQTQPSLRWYKRDVLQYLDALSWHGLKVAKLLTVGSFLSAFV